MRGYLYHNIVLVKSNLIAMGVFEALLFGAWTLFFVLREFWGDTAAAGDDMTGVAVIGGLIVLTSFLLMELVSIDFFKSCEGTRWCSFAISSPGSVEGYLGAKYKLLLGIDLLILLLWLLTDTLLGAFCRESLPLASVAFECCCIQLILQAVEIAFAVRLGAAFGSYCKYIFLTLIGIAALVYGLFGDISIFQQEDPLAAMTELVSSGGILWVIALLPYAALLIYGASYRYAVKVFRKGVELYED